MKRRLKGMPTRNLKPLKNAPKSLWDSSNACADYLEAVKLDPDYWLRLADKYKEQGKLQEAINAYTEGINTKPEAFAYSNQAAAYKESGDMKKALADLTKAIELEPSNHYYYGYRADFYSERDKFGAAAVDYTTQIKLITEPEDKDDVALFLAYRDRGRAYYSIEKWD